MQESNYFTEQEHEWLIPGAMGNLQILTHQPKQLQHNAIAVICHPHPQHGGTMHNKVVTTLHKAFDSLGMRTLRFNYRGVGNSDGEYDNGDGECQDLLTVLNWVTALDVTATLYVAGFSFGAYISYRVAVENAYRDKIAYLVSITMPQYSELKTLPEPNCPWLLVQGEDDEVVAASEVFDWIDTLKTPPQLLKMTETGHFFHGKLMLLREAIVKQLQ